MNRELTIEYIGPSEDDRAHLRLLMRKLGDGLASRWIWGEEHRADALFIDPSTLSGQMARTRAQEGGVRCILLDAVASSGPGEMVLQRPFRAEVLRQVLDLISSQRGGSDAAVAPATRAALTLELEPQDAPLDLGLLHAGSTRRSLALPEPTHDDAESLYRRMPTGQREPARSPIGGLASASLAPIDAPTARSQFRSATEPALPGLALAGTSPGPSRKDTGIGLCAFLDGDLLGGPSRIAVDGLPALSLDPKEHAFHTAAPLAALKPYLQMALRVSDWQALTSAQLRQIREHEPARDYLHLRWLDRMQSAGGQLPRRLDPGGTYRLSAPFEVAADFPAQQRIVRALANPIRLHELAAAASVRMAEVFDAVAALDAVGLIECRPRERLQRGPNAAAPAPAQVGLLARALASITLPRPGG